MKPIDFEHSNKIYGADQPEYQPLPALKIDGDQGEVVSCWKLNFFERIQVLFTGRVWLSVWTFNKPINPVMLSVKRNEIFIIKQEKK